MEKLLAEKNPIVDKLSPSIRTIFRLSEDIRRYDNALSGIIRRDDSPKDEVYEALAPITGVWHEMSVTLESSFNPQGANVPSLSEYKELRNLVLEAKQLFDNLVEKIKQTRDAYWVKIMPNTLKFWRNSWLDQLISVCKQVLIAFRGSCDHYLLVQLYRRAAWDYVNHNLPTVIVNVTYNRYCVERYGRCHPYFSAH